MAAKGNRSGREPSGDTTATAHPSPSEMSQEDLIQWVREFFSTLQTIRDRADAGIKGVVEFLEHQVDFFKRSKDLGAPFPDYEPWRDLLTRTVAAVADLNESRRSARFPFEDTHSNSAHLPVEAWKTLVDDSLRLSPLSEEWNRLEKRQRGFAVAQGLRTAVYADPVGKHATETLEGFLSLKATPPRIEAAWKVLWESKAWRNVPLEELPPYLARAIFLEGQRLVGDYGKRIEKETSAGEKEVNSELGLKDRARLEVFPKGSPRLMREEPSSDPHPVQDPLEAIPDSQAEKLDDLILLTLELAASTKSEEERDLLTLIRAGANPTNACEILGVTRQTWETLQLRLKRRFSA